MLLRPQGLGSLRSVGQGSTVQAEGTQRHRAAGQKVSQWAGHPSCWEPQVLGCFQVFSQVWLSQDNRTNKERVWCGSSAPKQGQEGVWAI